MTEHDLINGLRQGSHESFRMVYDQWAAPLYHYVLSLVKQEAVAQDIVQNTFVKLWERRESLEPGCSLKPYLFTISYHDIVGEFRQQARNPLMAEYLSYSRSASPSDDADSSLRFDEFAKRLARAKAKLTPRQREVFELRSEWGLKPREIGLRLGLGNQTVRNQLAAAMRIVKKELGTRSLLLAIIIMYETTFNLQ